MDVEYFIDRADPDLIRGWAFAPDGLDEIRVLRDREVIAGGRIDGERPDVHLAYPDEPESLRSGFAIVPRRELLSSPRCDIELEFVHRDGRIERLDRRLVLYVPGATAGTEPTRRSPFPPPIMRILSDLRGGTYYEHAQWTLELESEAIADLELVVSHGPQTIRGLYPYLGWLRQVWERITFVTRHFPHRNPERIDPRDKDFFAVGSTPRELFTIAHHLFVLRQHGLTGRFAEFGCFKGFSTACLSHACAQLGIGMDVFDSFAGLPASASHYHGSGEFAGTLDEVRRNVQEFGNPDVVRFHPGFFAETVPHTEVEPLCIWMDVDLQSSSADVMAMLPRLSPRSCVFSHECGPDNFSGEEVTSSGGADDVVGPITAAFARRGWCPVGRFLCDHTGVLWNRDTGIPVLSMESTQRLLLLT